MRSSPASPVLVVSGDVAADRSPRVRPGFRGDYPVYLSGTAHGLRRASYRTGEHGTDKHETDKLLAKPE